VIRNKGHYTWIYDTVLARRTADAAVVGSNHLQIK